MALYARFLDEILLRRCGGGDFIGNCQTVTLAYKNDMTRQVPLRHNSYHKPESRSANTGKRLVKRERDRSL